MTVSVFTADPGQSGYFDAMVYSYAQAGSGTADPSVNVASICHMKQLAIAAGWSGVDTGSGYNNVDVIVAIALAESGGQYWVWSGTNGDASRDRGILQINTIHTTLSDLEAMSGATSSVSGPDPSYILRPWQFARQLWINRGSVFYDWCTYRNIISGINGCNNCQSSGCGTAASYYAQVASTSCAGASYPSVANGQAPAIVAAQSYTNGFDAVGQALDQYNTYYCYQGFHAFNTASIGPASTIVQGGTFLQLTSAADNSSSDFTVEARLTDEFNTPGNVASAGNFKSAAQLSGMTLLANYNTNGGFTPGFTYSLANVALTDSTINKAGLTRMVISSSKQRTLSAPTGQESVSYYFGDSSFGKPTLTVQYNQPNTQPWYTQLPQALYSGGYARTGPSNTPWTLRFQASDAEQTAAGGLAWVLTRVSDGLTVMSGTFTSGALLSSTLAYNAPNLVDGTNQLRLYISDGVGPSNTADFVLLREDAPPVVPTVSTSPSVVVSQNYSVQWTPTASYSVGTGQLSYQIRTGAGGTGTLLASGTQTSGQSVSVPVVDPGYSGATRYVRVTNGAGGTTEASVVLNTNTPPTFTTQPSAGYGSRASAGPSNTFTVSFAATDAQQTGVNALAYRVFRQDGALVVGPISFTSSTSLQTTTAIAHSTLTSEGVNAGWYVTVTDGVSTSTSATFSVRKDSAAPLVTGATTSPPVVTSTSYSVTAIVSDATSTGANELTVEVRTAAGGGGSQLFTGTRTSSNVAQTIGPFTDGGVTNGAVRYLRVTDTAGNVAEQPFTVTYNSAPTFTSQPSVGYGTLTRGGPGNPVVFVTFTATDQQQTSLTYFLRNASNGLVGGKTGTCTSGSPFTIGLSYNDGGMSAGDTLLHVAVTDGTVLVDSNNFTVLVDPSPPTASTSISTSPSSPTSATQPYTVTFTPQDAASLSSSELRYQINSVTTPGIGPGSGNLKGGASGIACTSGTPVTTSSITADTLVNGANTRYIRVRDGAGTWSETLFSVVGSLAAEATLTLQTVGAGATASVVPMAAGKPIQAAVGGATLQAVTLSAPALLAVGAAASASTLNAWLSAPPIIRNLEVGASSGVQGILSTPVLVAIGLSLGTGISVHLRASAVLSVGAVTAGSTVGSNLDATLRPALLAPGLVPSTSSATALLAATPSVPFLVCTASGSSAGAASLIATPAVAFMTVPVVRGASGLSTNFRWVGGINIDFDNGPFGASTSLALSTTPILTGLVPSGASTALALSVGVNALQPPILLEMQGTTSSTADVLSEVRAATASSSSAQPMEVLGAIGRDRVLLVSWGALGGPSAPLEFEALYPVSGSSAMQVESRASVAVDLTPQVEIVAGMSEAAETQIEARTQVASVPSSHLESYSTPEASAILLVEVLQLSVFQISDVRLETLSAPGAPTAIPMEVSAPLVAANGEQQVEVLAAIVESALHPTEARKGLSGVATIQIETSGYVVDKNPDMVARLYVQRSRQQADLRPSRAGLTVKTFRF